MRQDDEAAMANLKSDLTLCVDGWTAARRESLYAFTLWQAAVSPGLNAQAAALLLKDLCFCRSASLQRMFVWKVADYSLESHTKEFLAREQMLAMLGLTCQAALHLHPLQISPCSRRNSEVHQKSWS